MKTLIVEDSRLAREGLTGMLSRYSQLDIIGAAVDTAEALAIIETVQPELIFLDIHLPGENGFHLLENLSYQPKIIFTTAYSEHAIQSFDHNTIDYLLKPISHDRLKKAIKKLENHIEKIEEKLDIENSVLIRDDENSHLIKLKNIEYIESCKNHVQVFFYNKSISLRKSFIKRPLSHIENKLPERHFFKANRQFIINLNFIERITDSIGDGFDITMKSGKEIEASRRNSTRLKDFLSI